jgi:hypothetical protein
MKILRNSELINFNIEDNKDYESLWRRNIDHKMTNCFMKITFKIKI